MTARPGDRPALGRGLASLIPGRPGALEAPAEIPLDRIVANPYQPRSGMDGADLEALAASIAEHGVLQPILVTETLEGYQLIAGERRVRAARMAGLTRIPAVVRQLADQHQLELALVENIQRSDLGPLEEAACLPPARGRVRPDPGADRREGRPGAIDRRELGPPARARPGSAGRPCLGQLSEGHARAMAGLGASDQLALLHIVISRGISVRQTEELARRMREPRPVADASAAAVDPDRERVEEDLRRALGTKVSLARSRRGGRIVIEFYSDEELGRLYDRLTGGPA